MGTRLPANTGVPLIKSGEHDTSHSNELFEDAMRRDSLASVLATTGAACPPFGLAVWR